MVIATEQGNVANQLIVDKTLLTKLFLFTMSTRSRIGLLLNDQHILSVYHHWDGYPSFLGVFLQQNYTTKEQIAELLDGGDISCIDSDTNWNRNKVDNHVLYYNDRGEKTEPRLDLNFDEYVKNADACEEFVYLFLPEDNIWECYEINHKYDDNYKVVSTNVVSREIKELVNA